MTDRGTRYQPSAAPLPEPLTRAERCRRLWDISGAEPSDDVAPSPTDEAPAVPPRAAQPRRTRIS